ncbi:unnamed protein product [Parnassius apollo]|uniref:(apollo) hypothetical protein n=1 Tax=Parnassius apollo TaxID=110799 RepID=A0A8S3WKL1_PARAO|nr:unnamed protein product [Parnassius apollo]
MAFMIKKLKQLEILESDDLNYVTSKLVCDISSKTCMFGSHADVPIQNEQSASTNIMSEKSLGLPEVSDDNQSMSDQSPEVSFNPLVEHNYCKHSKEHRNIKNWKSNLPSVVTPEKYRVHQQNIKTLRRQVYRLRKQGKDIKSQLENAV